MELQEQIKELELYKDLVKNVKAYKGFRSYIVECTDSMIASGFALMLSMVLLCDNGGCGQCSCCKKILNGCHVDIHKYPIKDKTFISTEDARKIVQESYVSSMEGRGKVFILDTSSKMDEYCQNILLKTLEEPNNDTFIVLIVRSRVALLPTIISRCQIFSIGEQNRKDIVEYLVSVGEKEFIRKDDELMARNQFIRSSAELVSYVSGGSYERALMFFKEKEYSKLLTDIIDMLENMQSTADYYKYIGNLIKYESLVDKILDALEGIFGEMIKSHITGEENLMIKTFTDKYSLPACLLIIEEIKKAKIRRGAKVRYVSNIDELVIKILEVKSKCR